MKQHKTPDRYTETKTREKNRKQMRTAKRSKTETKWLMALASTRVDRG